MNSVSLAGRITKDLDLKCTPNGKYVCEFSLAVNRIGTDKADFITCQIWGTQAENLVKYQGKGSLVGIVGSLRVDTYEIEGTKRYKTYVLVNNIEFLGTKKETNKENLTVQEPTQQEADPFEQMGMQIRIDDNNWLD